MKKTMLMLLLLIAVFLPSCTPRRSSGELWDDTQSCGRYMGRGVRTLGGKQRDSRQIQNRDDFSRSEYGAYEGDFVPLQDESGRNMITMEALSQPQYSPGDRGSNLPGIDSFSNPDNDPSLSNVYQHIHFQVDSERVTGQENLQRIERIASYMKNHPETHVFVEGHCDERGPQAYNLALGTRRANTVRTMLIAEGVNPDHLFTVSYGKERPLVPGRDESSLQLNRRAQFKVYER